MGVKISLMPELNVLTGTEIVPVVYNGTNNTFKLDTLLALFTKSRIGLDQVDNTSDIDKPVSAATQLILDTKSHIGHLHNSTDIGDFAAAVTAVVALNPPAQDVAVTNLEW